VSLFPSVASKKVLTEEDQFIDSPVEFMKWSSYKTIGVNGYGKFLQYNHDEPLSKKDCQNALDYIAALVSVYPVQLRLAMARPLWTRFCETYCDYGDAKAAMNSI
jgi:hypothetical protein